MLALLAHGCPVCAIVFAFGLDEWTVRDWEQRAGHHSEQVHQHLVQQPRDLGQVQADEIRVKMQTLVVWLAMALQVSTRLWLGAVISERRDETLVTALMQRIRACALCRPLLFCVDGFQAYLGAIRTVFREPIPTRLIGRPQLRAWDGIHIAQVVKQYAHGHVIGVVRRIIQGTEAQVKRLVQISQGNAVINTAYIERLNATFRARLAGLVRRGRSLTANPDAPGRRVSRRHSVQFLYQSCEFARAVVCRTCGTDALGATYPGDGSWYHGSSLVGV